MTEPPRAGWAQTLIVFGGGGLLLLAATRLAIPRLANALAIERIVAWFLSAGIGVFAPLLLLALLLLRREGIPATWDALRARLRLEALSRSDWVWAVGALVAIGVLTFGTHLVLTRVAGSVQMTPAFMTLEPLAPGRYWILLVWLPFWVLNIGGEEVLWRGVLLPRQEAAFGRHAWLANAVGWLLFHVAFGWQLMLLLLPIVCILPWVVQRSGNTTVGVIVHAGVNGPGFLAVAFGVA